MLNKNQGSIKKGRQIWIGLFTQCESLIVDFTNQTSKIKMDDF